MLTFLFFMKTLVSRREFSQRFDIPAIKAKIIRNVFASLARDNQLTGLQQQRHDSKSRIPRAVEHAGDGISWDLVSSISS